MTDSQQLLAEYTRTGSDAAFRDLINRYVDLVYSVALRLVDGDTHSAEDVAQTVFIDLARMGGTLGTNVMLGGWLHRHTCFVAAKLVRGERRRQSRERQAVEMNALQDHSESNFALFRPILDEAINELDEPDRTAILLRFFEQRDFRSVAEALGSNEDAARMRVTRALEKLESMLKRRGITTTAAALSTVLLANAVQSAPVGLAVTITTAAALVGTTASTSTAIAATKAIAMTTLQKAIISVTVAVVAGAGIYEAHQVSQLRQQVQTLRQERAPLAAQIRQLEEERDEATNRLATLRRENDSLRSDNADVLKLRGEIAGLRAVRQFAGASGETDHTGADTFAVAAKAWAARPDSIKHEFEQNPGKSIPELGLLAENDWLRVARTSLGRSRGWDTNEFELCSSELRNEAKTRFGSYIGHALASYVADNGGMLPKDPSQLLPYFDPPGDTSTIATALNSTLAQAADPSILQRYELLSTGNVSDIPQGRPIIREKTIVDDQHDTLLSVTLGSFSLQSAGKVTDLAQGQPYSWMQDDIERIQPFLKER